MKMSQLLAEVLVCPKTHNSKSVMANGYENRLIAAMTLLISWPWYQGSWANMGLIWGRQDQGGPHVGPMKFRCADVQDKFLLTWINLMMKWFIHSQNYLCSTLLGTWLLVQGGIKINLYIYVCPMCVWDWLQKREVVWQVYFAFWL